MRSLSLLAFLMAVLAVTAPAQVPAGGEFQVNSWTTSQQSNPAIGLSGDGEFTVTWTSYLQDGSSNGVFAQRYREDGTPLNAEFQVNNVTLGSQTLSSLAVGNRGEFLVAWSGGPDGTGRFDVFARLFDRAGVPSGAEFRVSDPAVSGNQYRQDVAALTGGEFVVTWSHQLASYPLTSLIMARRHGRDGIPVGVEFLVGGATAGLAHLPAIAAGPEGTFVVVWKQDVLPGSRAIVGRLFDGTGTALGTEFQVNTASGVYFGFPSVGMAADGSFVVVWEHGDPFGAAASIHGRRFLAGGTPVGSEFAINATTVGSHRVPFVALDKEGNFVVSWSRDLAGDYDVFVRRFTASGIPRGDELRVNTFTSFLQEASALAVDATGNFVVAWTSEGPDGSYRGVAAQRFGGLRPVAARVDRVPTPSSDGNGVLEAGEEVSFEASWRNFSGATLTFGGTLTRLSGPGGASYAIPDPSGDYGVVPDDGTAGCSDCYSLSVSAPVVRPASHWDATGVEAITPDALGNRQPWVLHVGGSFTDVSRTSPFYRFVETLFHSGATAGCAPTEYCPHEATLREQMAALILVAFEGAGYAPPACASPPFDDVPVSSPFCPFVAELARRGVAGGCGGNRYCPTAPVTRQEMAVFVLRTLDPQLDPPQCTTPLFADVPASSPFCRWIEELSRRGVVAGCGGGNYCPGQPVTREQVSVFVSAGFGLALYGP